MKALRIKQCPDPLMWYAGMVGQTVPYCGQWPEAYKSREPAGHVNRVEFADAEIVETEESMAEKVKVTVTTERTLILPALPDHIRGEHGTVVPIEALTQGQLREIGQKWTEALMRRARDRVEASTDLLSSMADRIEQLERAESKTPAQGPVERRVGGAEQ